MKLANHLSTKLAILFLAILLLWSVIYFFMQMHEIYDGIDEGLTNLKQEFLVQAEDDPLFVEVMEKYAPLNMRVEEISQQEAMNFQEVFLTTKIYFHTEEEDEEVRLLRSAFRCEANNKYYKLEFFTSTVESEDLIENMLTLLIVLWITLGLLLFVASRRIIKDSSKPFNILLSRLQRFNLNRTEMIEFPKTNISEFKDLNSTIEILLQGNIEAYKEQKNFIENASHEMQTPLAVVISKIELLMSKQGVDREQLQELNQILTNLNRMKRLNSSLLLLSKIRNRQFVESSLVDFREIVEEVCDNFIDIVEHKELSLNINIESYPQIEMNKDLAHIMVTNLVKNAVNYNIVGGKIDIELKSDSLQISNDGEPIDDGVNIFERYSSLNSSSGLGLAIVSSIATLYHFRLSYNYTDKHIISVYFK